MLGGQQKAESSDQKDQDHKKESPIRKDRARSRPGKPDTSQGKSLRSFNVNGKR